MMTREEAIAILQEKYDYCKSFYDLAARPKEDYAETAQYLQALQVALSALRPVSREQVERVWYRRGWKYDNPRVDGGIMYSATNTCMYCGSETPIGNFCYRCGIAQTDMGVDVVMERLEVLYNETR